MKTRTGYDSVLRRFVLPTLGDREVASIGPAEVADIIRAMRASDVSPWLIAETRAAIGSSFRPLVPELIARNPAHGHRVRRPPAPEFPLITPYVFQRIVAALRTPGAQVFATTLAVTGARYSEVAELRPIDLDGASGVLTIRRRVTEPGAARNGGSRFRVEYGTKAGGDKGRTIGLPRVLVDRLQEWIREHEIGSRDLLFPGRLVTASRAISRELPAGYSASPHAAVGHPDIRRGATGICYCDHCQPTSSPVRRPIPKRTTNQTGHMPNAQWNRMWHQASAAAALDWVPRTQDLRHACATLLVAQGVSLTETMTILGHTRMETTLRYQHRVMAMQSRAAEVSAMFLTGN